MEAILRLTTETCNMTINMLSYLYWTWTEITYTDKNLFFTYKRFIKLTLQCFWFCFFSKQWYLGLLFLKVSLNSFDNALFWIKSLRYNKILMINCIIISFKFTPIYCIPLLCIDVSFCLSVCIFLFYHLKLTVLFRSLIMMQPNKCIS